MAGMADAMTDNQWNGILKLVYLLLKNSKSKEQAMKELKALMRDSKEFEEFLKEEESEA